MPLRLGCQGHDPGFEEQLIGAATPGETRELSVTFPADYGQCRGRGQGREFTVTVKEVKAPVAVTLDDDWAKELGSRRARRSCKDTFAKRFADEYQSVSRTRLKRALLDQLAERYQFAVPQGMVDLEFEAIWKQLQDEMERTGAALASRARARTS